MAGTPFPLTVPVGAAFVQSFTWYTDRKRTKPKDLTGYRARMKVRAKLNDAEHILYLDTLTGQTGQNGSITLGGVDGTIILEVDETVTTPITAKTGVYDLVIIPPNSGDPDPTVLVGGPVMFEPIVSRP